MPVNPAFIQAGAEAAGSAANGILGMVLGGVNDRRQARQQRRLNKIALENHKQTTEYNMRKQMELWEATNYGAQVEQLKKAGLSPGLIYGMGGGGGASIAADTGASGQAGSAPAGGGEIPAAMGMGIERMLAAASIKKMDAETEKVKAETEKTKGVDTENVKADTENKILQAVVTKYTGEEAKDVYERVKRPNREIEAKTYQDEMEARQGIAGTVYELWKEGKLHEKSISEIEQIALNNAKTREETRNIYKTGEILEENLKGAKIDNVIKDLEARLQTETGIDKTSPAWMKILGRLFVELINK